MNKVFNEEKMYTYVKGYAMGANMPETLKSLYYARDKHKEQKRKDGTPYIIHPLTMACNAISMGVSDDNIIAVILLHDVVEDCNVTLDELPNNDIVKRGVDAITFKVFDNETKEDAKRRYYNMMADNKEAAIAKLIDRCHNVSSMAGVFKEEKLVEYIEETRQYVLPLLREAKNRYPEMSNILFSLKYHICSVVDAIDITLKIKNNKGV